MRMSQSTHRCLCSRLANCPFRADRNRGKARTRQMRSYPTPSCMVLHARESLRQQQGQQVRMIRTKDLLRSEDLHPDFDVRSQRLHTDSQAEFGSPDSCAHPLVPHFPPILFLKSAETQWLPISLLGQLGKCPPQALEPGVSRAEGLCRPPTRTG